MKAKHINWRKATEEEIKTGSPEMIKVSEEEIDVPDTENNVTDIVSLLKTQSPEQLFEIKKLLGL